MTIRDAAAMAARVTSGGAVHVAQGGGVLRLTATDYDVTIRCEAAVAADCATVDAFVRARDLARALASLQDDGAALREDGAQVEVKGRAGTHILATVAAVEMPEIDDAGPGAAPMPDLAAVAAAASRDETRPALCGVRLDDSGAVATDGHRLHHLAAEGLPACTIHRRALDLLRHMPGPLRLAPAGRSVVIEGGGCSLAVRQIVEEYPVWRRVVPDASPADGLPIDVAAMAAAVRRVSALAEPMSTVRITRRGAVMTLRLVGDRATSTADVELRGIDADVTDVPAEIGVNPIFLLDALDAMDVAECRMHFTGTLEPVLLLGDRVRCVVMPMRV